MRRFTIQINRSEMSMELKVRKMGHMASKLKEDTTYSIY